MVAAEDIRMDIATSKRDARTPSCRLALNTSPSLRCRPAWRCRTSTKCAGPETLSARAIDQRGRPLRCPYFTSTQGHKGIIDGCALEAPSPDGRRAPSSGMVYNRGGYETRDVR